MCTLLEEVSHLIQLDSISHVSADHLPIVHALRHKRTLGIITTVIALLLLQSSGTHHGESVMSYMRQKVYW